jgi:hypothetical protein
MLFAATFTNSDEEQTSLPLSVHLNALKECIMNMRISSILD